MTYFYSYYITSWQSPIFLNQRNFLCSLPSRMQQSAGRWTMKNQAWFEQNHLFFKSLSSIQKAWSLTINSGLYKIMGEEAHSRNWCIFLLFKHKFKNLFQASWHEWTLFLSRFYKSNLEAVTVNTSRTTFSHEAPSSAFNTVHGSVNQKSCNYIGFL